MLKVLLMRSKLDKLNAQLGSLREKQQGFLTREQELEAAIGEMNEDTSDEDRQEIESQVEEHQRQREENEQAIGDLEQEISDLENEIKEEEERQHTPPQNPETQNPEEREDRTMGEGRSFFGMNRQERDQFFAREDVKNFLQQIRTCISEKRALSNVGLTIPEAMLELLKTKVEETSKLIGRVNRRTVSGTARQRIMGAIPEAVWTEMCAKLNELDLAFNDVEVDGYKVGGYFAVCNAILEDNDVNLASEIINALGKAIGKALDHAIVYGKGTKMPLGIVTRLAQDSEPEGYSKTARKWEKLDETHILTGTGATGMKLFQEIVGDVGVIENDYSESGLVWMMNKKTHTKLMVQSMDKNLNAAIVAGIGNQMPVIGGDIVELSFIPDDNIVFGYMDMYLLAERAGTAIGQSEHYRFLEDQTVFRGTARYDGTPVIAEAFAVISISQTEPAKESEFPLGES